MAQNRSLKTENISSAFIVNQTVHIAAFLTSYFLQTIKSNQVLIAQGLLSVTLGNLLGSLILTVDFATQHQEFTYVLCGFEFFAYAIICQVLVSLNNMNLELVRLK